MTQCALILATSSTLVVTLVKSSGSVLGPGARPRASRSSGMRAALALRDLLRRSSSGSKPPMTMPEGLRATASLKAAWMPAGVPPPSITRTFQPMAFAASRTPCAAPATPGLVMVWAT